MHPAWLPLLTDLILAKLGIALQSFSKEKKVCIFFLKRKSILVNVFLKKNIILHLKYYCSFNFLFCYQLMQNYFKTLYFTISSKTTVQFRFIKGQGFLTGKNYAYCVNGLRPNSLAPLTDDFSVKFVTDLVPLTCASANAKF